MGSYAGKLYIIIRGFTGWQFAFCYPWVRRPSGCTLLSVGSLIFIFRNFIDFRCSNPNRRILFIWFKYVDCNTCLMLLAIRTTVLLFCHAVCKMCSNFNKIYQNYIIMYIIVDFLRHFVVVYRLGLSKTSIIAQLSTSKKESN